MPRHTGRRYKTYVPVEVIDDVWIEGLDPDAQEAITSALTKRVDATRETHARLATSRGAEA